MEPLLVALCLGSVMLCDLHHGLLPPQQPPRLVLLMPILQWELEKGLV